MSEIKTSRNKRIIEYRQKNPCLTCKSPCPFEVRPCLLLYRYEIIEKIKAQLIQVGRQEVVEWINANTYYGKVQSWLCSECLSRYNTPITLLGELK